MMFHVNADLMKRIPWHVLVREAWEITVRVRWLHPKDGHFNVSEREMSGGRIPSFGLRA